MAPGTTRAEYFRACGEEHIDRLEDWQTRVWLNGYMAAVDHDLELVYAFATCLSNVGTSSAASRALVTSSAH